MIDNRITVSVHMITYNHENFIAQAIESIVMQKTKFIFDLIISDDCSTDNTSQIIKKYKRKYPEIIKPIFRNHNVGSINNFIDTFNYCTGKYIALCEGDDYWIDPYKLQKQVDFLEANPEYGLVHGDCHIYFQGKDKWLYNANKNLINKNEFNNKKVLFYGIVNGEYKIRTATVLFRRDLLKKIDSAKIRFLMGDTPLWLEFSQITKFKYFDEVLAVYRISTGTVSRPNNKKEKLRFSLSMAEMRVYYSKKYNYEINNKLKQRYNKALLAYFLFEPDYLPLFPLLEPTKLQQFKKRYIQLPFWRKLFKMELYLTVYLKALINKINSIRPLIKIKFIKFKLIHYK